jgi:hypothetical protein
MGRKSTQGAAGFYQRSIYPPAENPPKVLQTFLTTLSIPPAENPTEGAAHISHRSFYPLESVTSDPRRLKPGHHGAPSWPLRTPATAQGVKECPSAALPSFLEAHVENLRPRYLHILPKFSSQSQCFTTVQLYYQAETAQGVKECPRPALPSFLEAHVENMRPIHLHILPKFSSQSQFRECFATVQLYNQAEPSSLPRAALYKRAHAWSPLTSTAPNLQIEGARLGPPKPCLKIFSTTRGGFCSGSGKKKNDHT